MGESCKKKEGKSKEAWQEGYLYLWFLAKQLAGLKRAGVDARHSLSLTVYGQVVGETLHKDFAGELLPQQSTEMGQY